MGKNVSLDVIKLEKMRRDTEKGNQGLQNSSRMAFPITIRSASSDSLEGDTVEDELVVEFTPSRGSGEHEGRCWWSSRAYILLT
jgi:hypothetical protein